MQEKVKILIVDDSMTIRQAIEKNLREFHIEVVGTAGDGKKALELFRTADPDVVTLDITMPELDGITVLEEMMKLNKYISVLIPRGSASLINEVIKNSTVPVIETGVGICHIYVTEDADFDMAVDITVNAKTSKPSVCNAAEVLLVDESISKEFLPMVAKGLAEYEVELRGCEKTCGILKDAKPAGVDDYDTEFLDYIMAMKVVSGIDEAILHINTHGTRHSESIVTSSKEKAEKFQIEIDAAAVYCNASTRFTDGGEFGMGAEIGISTQMLHARGPMGLKELTSYKYVISGNGQIR
jgi:glutamate-5-semialdehyde dehydrogenase